MHDLLRDMGREIVRHESPSWPGKRSRIWSSEDIIHILEANVGSESIEMMMIWLQGCSGLPQLPSSILNLTLPKYMPFNGHTGPSWLKEIEDVVLLFVKTLMFGDDLLYRQLPGLSSWELSRLDSSNLMILPKTTELPSNKKHFMAVNCSWLTSESLSILLNVVANEHGIRNFLLPGASVPDWFHHRSKGPSLSFWCRKKFPLIALCAIVSAPRRTYVEFREIVLTINGSQVFTLNIGLKDQTLVTDHIFMFDLGARMAGHMVDRLTIKHGWNHVEISGITYRQDFVNWMGVYVYKWESNGEDISFTRPNTPPRRTFDDLELLEDPTMKDHPVLLEEGLDIDTELPTIMYYNDVTPSIWEAIWNMQAARPIKVLLWEICQHDLPIYQSLFQRKICDSPLCPICGEEDETLEHLFLLCPWTQPIWFESEFQWIVDFNSLECIEVWLLQRFQIIKMGHQNFNQVNALIGCICWAIWHGRNDFVFEGQPVNPMHTLNRAETMYKKYFGPSLIRQTILPKFSVYYKIGRPSDDQVPETRFVQERRRSAWESWKEFDSLCKRRKFKMALG
ncbi:hypothetical protein L6164_017466 [Bauhinia variegata]|uniref:Uncharacterized protein n=1 Tax=Bauhinia variegata TaxID=167791 RepID=A0ACB9N9X1_BAUVA|nr:hypothetical protein L6164_017466 [Bauhinia variegata]